MSAGLDAENTPPLSDAELEKVRVFGLDRRRIINDVDGIRFGFLILAWMGLFLLGVASSVIALVSYGLGHP